MIDINLTNLFDDFYHTRFFVLLNLSLFSFLLALRLDETIEWSYWLVFMPLWIWKGTAFFGMIFGTISWCRLSRRRFDSETFLHYKAMLISFSTNLILFLFEIIVCDKLESQNKIAWSICFIPLFILSLVSIGTCIWSIRHDRSYEIELFCALNLLQFVFVSLRLDTTITWSWVLVLIPIWILMCIAFIILLYFVIITIIILSRNHPNNLQHHSHYKPTQRWLNVIYYTVFLFSLLAFAVVLTHKLDAVMASPNIMHHFQIFMQPNPPSGYLASQSTQNHQFVQAHNQQQSTLLEKSLYYLQNRQQDQNVQKSYLSVPSISHLYLPQSSSVTAQAVSLESSTTISSTARSTTTSAATTASSTTFSNIKLSYFLTVLPLQLSYLCLILLSFNSHSGNLWWFGMRRDFCELFLIVCPVFKIYGNVQLKFSCFSIEEGRSRSSVGGEARSSSVSTTANQSNRTRNLRNANRSASEHNDSIQNQQQQSLIAASAAADANSNETSLVTLNIFRSQSNPSHPTTLRGTGGAASTISQQNQLIASDFDEISSMDDCLDVALTTLSTSSSGTTNNVNVVTFQGANSSVNNNRRIKFLNKKFNLRKNFKKRNIGSASQSARGASRRSSNTTSNAVGSAGGTGSILLQQSQPSQPQQPSQPTQRQYSFRSYHSAYSSDRCSEKGSRKSKNPCLPLSHLHGSSRRHSQPTVHQLNKLSMGTIIQLDVPD